MQISGMDLKRRFFLVLIFLGFVFLSTPYALQPAHASSCNEPLGDAHQERLTSSGWRITEDLKKTVTDPERSDDEVVPVFFYSYVSNFEDTETPTITPHQIQRESFQRMIAAVTALAAQHHFHVLNTIPGGRIVVAEMTLGTLRALVNTPPNDSPGAADLTIEPAWRIALNTATVTVARP